MTHSFSGTGIQASILDKPNAGFPRKFAFMTLVVFAVYGILSVVGFYLWFLFPVEHTNGLTYLNRNDLILYYMIVNFNDVAGVLLFSSIIYYRYVKTSTPLKDGILLGIYLLIFSWILDLFVYVFIRKTLPTLHEYFLGKNQPEIGIAWMIGFLSALSAGWLHSIDKNRKRRVIFRKAMLTAVILTMISFILTYVGITFFDVKP